MATEPTLALLSVSKSYPAAGGAVEVLKGIDLTLHTGAVVALAAPSGAGKSTLLHIAGLLDTPTSGRVLFEGRDTATLSDGARTALRGDRIGFVYQFHHLLPELTARENALLPFWTRGLRNPSAEERIDMLLDRLGVGHRAHHRPAALSGGERQRVAVARALARKPALVLADEPTGSLDTASGAKVFEALLDAARADGASVLFATHNPELAARADDRITLDLGRMTRPT
jgi:lipoprotein-releasing system ATP-binding protein